MLQFPKDKLITCAMNDFPLRNLRYLIREELTKTDKAEIKRIARKEVESELKAKLSKAVEDEVAKALKDKATKDEIGVGKSRPL